MAYRVEIRDAVWGDLERIPRNLQARIVRAIEERLATAPTQYGVRLRQALSGLWKIRVGDYRIVYEMKDPTVMVWAIRHRTQVYGEATRRWLRS